MSSVEDRLSEVCLQVSTLKGHWDNGLSLVQKLLQDVPKIKADLDVLRNQFSNHKVELATFFVDVERLKGLVATIREEFSRNLTIESQSLLRNIEDKHANIARIANEHSSKIERFESLIEEIAVDSKNAVLKANNAEMVTVLNKKKIENACLLVQNQQLQK